MSHGEKSAHGILGGTLSDFGNVFNLGSHVGEIQWEQFIGRIFKQDVKNVLSDVLYEYGDYYRDWRIQLQSKYLNAILNYNLFISWKTIKSWWKKI